MLEEPLENRKVLEVGCGLALPSLVVKKRGGDITASDYHPLTERFLIGNAKRNSLEPIAYKAGNWNTDVSELGTFDLIIGSDLLYEPHHIDLLANFIDLHVKPKAEVIIVDAGRGSHRKFARAMQERGYSHIHCDLSDYSEGDKREKGCVLRFKCNKDSTTGA